MLCRCSLIDVCGCVPSVCPTWGWSSAGKNCYKGGNTSEDELRLGGCVNTLWPFYSPTPKLSQWRYRTFDLLEERSSCRRLLPGFAPTVQ